MYMTSILWYLSWPVLIYVSYRLVYFSVMRFEKNQWDPAEENQEME